MSEEKTGGEVAVVETATPSTNINNSFDIVDVDAAKAFMDNYLELVDALLDSTDYQQIGDKKAKKKSAWRKLATAFNISDDIINEEITTDENNQIISAKYYVKATMPNGRSSIGVGFCSIYDKIRYKGKNPDTSQPSNFVLRGRFSNAEHDVPATAHTRAKSRAIADLIGSGENSAEEFGDDFTVHDSAKSNGKKKRKKTVVKEEVQDRPSKPKFERETPVVEAEIVSNDEPKSKPKKIADLKDEYPQVATAIERLQADKKRVSRENIVDTLMTMYESNEITLDEYQTAKQELT